ENPLLFVSATTCSFHWFRKSNAIVKGKRVSNMVASALIAISSIMEREYVILTRNAFAITNV
ncbi:hypothetical protein GYH30_043389, partial [Glycine max]